MELTISIFIILILSAFSIHNRCKFYNIIIVGFFILIISYILSSRNINFNSDTSVYIYYSDTVHNFIDVFNTYNTDYFFWFISWMNNLLFGEEYYLLFITLFITSSLVIAIYYVSSKLNLDKYIGVLIYFLCLTPTFYLQASNTLRQAAVIGIIFIAINLFIEKKYIVSLLLNGLAFFIHGQTILMLFPFYIGFLIIKKININIKIVSFALFSAFIFQFFILDILNAIGLNVYVEKIIRYQNAWSSDSLYIKLAMSILLICIYTSIKNKDHSHKDFELYIIKPYIVLVSISLLFSPFGEVASRFLSITVLFDLFIILYLFIHILLNKKYEYFLFGLFVSPLIFILIQYHPSLIFNLNKVSMFYD